MDEELVVLVDREDNALGVAPKLQTHREGSLHRAVSVFIFRRSGELLLQRRSSEKYHSGGLWTNTCCGHPRPGEATAHAAKRRLYEEMGLACAIQHVFSFVYRADLGRDLLEHELDHVFVGVATADPVPNAGEVSDWRWIPIADLMGELALVPEEFTVWFPMALTLLLAHPLANPRDLGT